MSYEGFTQYLCTNGHYHSKDAFDDYGFSYNFECPYCDASEAWSNSVNTTNGSWETNLDGEEERIDGYVELKVLTPAGKCTCNNCGNTHFTTPEVYEIPKRKSV